MRTLGHTGWRLAPLTEALIVLPVPVCNCYTVAVGNASSWYRFLTVTCVEKAAPTAGKVHGPFTLLLQDLSAALCPAP